MLAGPSRLKGGNTEIAQLRLDFKEHVGHIVRGSEASNVVWMKKHIDAAKKAKEIGECIIIIIIINNMSCKTCASQEVNEHEGVHRVEHTILRKAISATPRQLRAQCWMCPCHQRAQ